MKIRVLGSMTGVLGPHFISVCMNAQQVLILIGRPYRDHFLVTAHFDAYDAKQGEVSTGPGTASL